MADDTPDVVAVSAILYAVLVNALADRGIDLRVEIVAAVGDLSATGQLTPAETRFLRRVLLEIERGEPTAE